MNIVETIVVTGYAIAILILILGCAPMHRPCFTTLDLTVFGSESNGSSVGGGLYDDGSQDEWDTDDVTVGGSATMTFDFTGSCEWEEE